VGVVVAVEGAAVGVGAVVGGVVGGARVNYLSIKTYSFVIQVK